MPLARLFAYLNSILPLREMRLLLLLPLRQSRSLMLAQPPPNSTSPLWSQIEWEVLLLCVEET